MEGTVTDSLERSEPPVAEAAPLFAEHVERRTVVLPDRRLLFLPIPKAGCTSILWTLAELAGVSTEAFEHSTLAEVSPALTIHDMQMWGAGHRLADYRGEERERILTEEGWFRFTVVRHPATRLWSAWQSKLLLREPRFVATFGEKPWFPRIPEEPAEIIEDFRRFVAVLASGAVEDVHWAVQHELAARLPLTHVGHVEQLKETLTLLKEHLGEDLPPTESKRENRTNLPLPPSAYDDPAAAVLHERYRPDFEQYGYDFAPPREDFDEAEWNERVLLLVPALRDAIDKHARIGQLQRVASRVQNLERRIEKTARRQVGHSRAPTLANEEGHTDFNVRWSWSHGNLEPGFTAVVRAKDEADMLPWVLPPLLQAVRRVVLVDNGSTDGTMDVARRVAGEVGAVDRLEVHSYPFQIARCGDEHLATRAASVHSLVYFYNWSFSHVRTGYALKWDADMVLTDPAVNVLRDLAWQLEGSQAVVKIPRYPLYVADDRRAFLDLGLYNCEPWAWPNRPGYSFVKALEWEQPLWPADLPAMILPDWSCLELKRLDADEFAHWSHTEFGASARTRRKQREWQVFHALANGAESPPDVLAVEAPEGQHVVEYVRSTWMREKAREREGLGERLVRQLIA
jgi:hypothetical protein